MQSHAFFSRITAAGDGQRAGMMMKSFTPSERAVAALLLETYWETIKEQTVGRKPSDDLTRLYNTVSEVFSALDSSARPEGLPADPLMEWELMKPEKRDAVFDRIIEIHRTIPTKTSLRAHSFSALLEVAHVFCYALSRNVTE